jgi:hypothetical protein
VAAAAGGGAGAYGIEVSHRGEVRFSWEQLESNKDPVKVTIG